MKWKKDKGQKEGHGNTGPEHPLTNYLVLQNFLIYDTSPQAILRNRLVCKSWNEANHARWKQLEKFPVLRYSQSQATDSKTYKPITTLAEFYTQLQNQDADVMNIIPPRKLNLHEWEHFAGESDMSELDSWFWSLISTNWLTNLTLTDSHFHEDIPIYKQSFLSSMPSLKSLVLISCVVHPKAVERMNQDILVKGIGSTRYRDGHVQNLELNLTLSPEVKNNELQFWISLFGLLPSVKYFRWDGVIHRQITLWYFQEFLDSCQFHDFASTLTSLDLLEFSGVARDNGFKLPQSSEFENLKHVALDIGICRRWPGDSTYFLLYPTLKHVTLYRAPFTSQFLNLLLSQSVETLELWGNVVSSLKYRNVGDLRFLRKLIWNTSCYEDKYHGRRTQRLLEGKRKSFPLFTKDLIKDTGDDGTLFTRLVYLDIDFGPLTSESWNRLGQYGLALTTLKAVFGEDGHLELVVRYWPNLVCLKLKHRSSVSASALLNQLPELERLTEFRWKSCACTQSRLTDAAVLRQIQEKCRKLKEVEFPWKWTGYGDELVVEKACKQAEFENALLLAAKKQQSANVQLQLQSSDLDGVAGVTVNRRIHRRHVNKRILDWVVGLTIVIVLPSLFVYILMYLCF